MASTRFHDDECRIKKQLQESTGPGKYMLNVPGQGSTLTFFDDPHIRMQNWGANLRTNFFDLENELRRPSNNFRDCANVNEDRVFSIAKDTNEYNNEITSQSRVTHPIWEFREKGVNNFDYLFMNPQENVCFPFHNNISTRITEKDDFLFNKNC
uniref:Uncharacterized protein n=1 Tax=Nucleocytoviricota sp. TaxID=2809609 RepID=A0A9E8JWQ8_9VIRU|nr:hypothetical protein [Nucleocytoviricota sp.]UZT29130.1 hypothetical protein [Nucleocytoviricota sp.]